MNQIIKEYENGFSTYKLARKYKCSNETISRRLKENGINVTPIIDLPIKQIITYYQNGISIRTIAKKYKCSPPTIIQRLRDNGIEIKPYFDKDIIMNLPTQKICEKYLDGIGTIELAEEYGCSSPTIIKKLRCNGIKIRQSSAILSIELPNIIIQEYLTNMNTIKLAEKYKCTVSTIIRKLRDKGIDVSEEKRRHHSVTSQDITYNEWNGFVCEQKYCSLFSSKFKEIVRNFHNRRCFICGKSEKDNNRKLSVHHVNYDKNCLCGSLCEFVPLCSTCHNRTNFNRKYWEDLIMCYLYPNKYFMIDL